MKQPIIKHSMKKLLAATVFSLSGTLAFSTSAIAAEPAANLDQLLKQVEQGRISENKSNGKREQRFLSQKNTQKQQLSTARTIRKEKEQESARLEKQFEKNETMLASKQTQLKEKMGNLTELFGHLTASSGDLRSITENSLVSTQFPGREVFLDELIDKMNGSERLPSIEEIERLWFEMQREMTESGRVAAFDTTVIRPGGEQGTERVIRIGTFNAVTSDGQYLTYDKGTLSVLDRQPKGSYTDWAATLASSNGGLTSFGIDPTGPTGGSYLAALINSPSLLERWHQGGVIGYIISGIGVFAVIIALWRLLALTLVGMKVSGQLKSKKANTNNPLGRVLKVHEDNPRMDPETLELKLSEAVVREVPKLESQLALLKIISAVAPLMGLLGTVTGMIITFQAITIFGAGDPKAMAGGISGALVTTVLGLVVAIPTVLLHTMVNGRAKALINILVEQSTGIIAEHTEAKQTAIAKKVRSAAAKPGTKPVAKPRPASADV